MLERACEAKVGHFRTEMFVQEYVMRLDIAMENGLVAVMVEVGDSTSCADSNGEPGRPR